MNSTGVGAEQERMPRVMMVVPQYPYPVLGGLERQAHELAKALREAGMSVQALSGAVGSAQRGVESVEGVPVHRVPWPTIKWLRFVRTPIDVLRVLYANRESYDVIHLHQYSWFGLFTILGARLLGKPVLTKLPNVGDLGIPGLLAQRLGRVKLAILKRSDGLVAMSKESLDELECVRYPAARVLATPNGIRLSKVRAGGQVDGRPMTTSCSVVFVGRLSEEKRLTTLLAAWREVVAVVSSPVSLELWGSGPDLAALQQRCGEFGISDSVFFRGQVDGVRDRLRSMEIFVLPSRAEGNSNAILEAMDAGLPIVASHVGGTPMLVGAQGIPFLFDVDDARTLAFHLITLIKNPVLRSRLGSAMRRRAESYFDIKQVARTYTDAYRSLSAGQRNRLSEGGGLPLAGEDEFRGAQ